MVILHDRSTDVKKLSNLTLVCTCYKCSVVKISFTLFRLLCQDVAVVSVFSFEFPCPGEREALLGRGIGLYLWHFVKI